MEGVQAAARPPHSLALQAWRAEDGCGLPGPDVFVRCLCACLSCSCIASAVEVVLLAFLSLMVLPVYALTTAAGSHSAESGKALLAQPAPASASCTLLAQPAPASASCALLQRTCVLAAPHFSAAWPRTLHVVLLSIVSSCS